MDEAWLVVDPTMSMLSRKDLDAYEVYVAYSTGMAIEVKDGSVDVFKTYRDKGLSVRVLKARRPGFAFSTDFSTNAISDLVKRVVHVAGSSDPDSFVAFPDLSAKKPPQLHQFDHDLHTVSVKKKIDMTRCLEAAARSSDQRITKVRKASYVETTQSVCVSNQTGLKLSCQKTIISASILLVAEEGENAETGWEYRFSPFLHSINMESIGKTATRRAVRMLGARTVKTMSAPGILSPWVASDFLSVLSESFMADNIQKGKSLLAGRIGEPIFSSCLTIVDDGLYPGGIASNPFDGEGTFQGRNVLVSDGVLQGFLYDKRTANKEGRDSTGNAGRHGVKAPPSVQATNFFICKGKLDPGALQSSLHKALMVTDIIGLHTADPVSCDFSVGAAGLWLEDGKITHPVRGITLSGNLIDLFKSVEGVGTDQRFYGRFGSPSLTVASLNIGGLGH